MVEHIDIPDAQLHEPKGAAGASSGQVYVANGAGSGAWAMVAADDIGIVDSGGYYSATEVEAALQELRAQDPTGWCQYTDTFYTGGTVLTIATSPGTVLPCNKGTSIETNAPRDMTGTLWNSSTNKFTPINENDYYILRVSFIIATLTGTVNYVQLSLDIGGSIGVVFQDTRVPRAVGQEMVFTVPVYTGTTFVPNGGQFSVVKDGAGTFEIEDIGISVVRVHRGR